jgi:hypothetical protein
MTKAGNEGFEEDPGLVPENFWITVCHCHNNAASSLLHLMEPKTKIYINKRDMGSFNTHILEVYYEPRRFKPCAEDQRWFAMSEARTLVAVRQSAVNRAANVSPRSFLKLLPVLQPL